MSWDHDRRAEVHQELMQRRSESQERKRTRTPTPPPTPLLLRQRVAPLSPSPNPLHHWRKRDQSPGYDRFYEERCQRDEENKRQFFEDRARRQLIATEEIKKSIANHPKLMKEYYASLPKQRLAAKQQSLADQQLAQWEALMREQCKAFEELCNGYRLDPETKKKNEIQRKAREKDRRRRLRL